MIITITLFFDPKNIENYQLRQKVAMDALEDLLQWLKKPNSVVGIHDATNSNKRRRKTLVERVAQEPGVQYIIIESIFTDEQLAESNLLAKIKNSPDYENIDEEIALSDLRNRIKEYEKTAETVDDDEGVPYIKMINSSNKIIVNQAHGYLLSQIVRYLMNIHTVSRPIWLTRHGESEYNRSGKIGGDPDLTERGLVYAKRLAEHFNEEAKKYPTINVWSSTLKRTIQTVQFINLPHKEWSTLNEIDAGVCDGMTYEEIKQTMPDIHKARTEDKLGFRYPGGESYIDVIQRLKPIICELERLQTPVLVVSHQAVIRTLLSYFINQTQENLPHIDTPLETVFQLTPTLYGCEQVIIDLSCQKKS